MSVCLYQVCDGLETPSVLPVVFLWKPVMGVIYDIDFCCYCCVLVFFIHFICLSYHLELWIHSARKSRYRWLVLGRGVRGLWRYVTVSFRELGTIFANQTQAMTLLTITCMFRLWQHNKWHFGWENSRDRLQTQLLPKANTQPGCAVITSREETSGETCLFSYIQVLVI